MVTNTNNSVPGNSDGISQLISRVINRFDSNGDGQLSNTEFTQFLTGLLSGAGLGSTTAAGASATASTTQPVPTGQYRSMLAGFDAKSVRLARAAPNSAGSCVLVVESCTWRHDCAISVGSILDNLAYEAVPSLAL